MHGSTPPFAMFDTGRPDGCYVNWERLVLDDPAGSPTEYLFQDEAYRETDQRRLNAWKRGAWKFIAIRARAHVLLVKNGHGFGFAIDSAGLWSIESDSGKAYLAAVFEQEKAELTGWLREFAAAFPSEGDPPPAGFATATDRVWRPQDLTKGRPQ